MASFAVILSERSERGIRCPVFDTVRGASSASRTKVLRICGSARIMRIAQEAVPSIHFGSSSAGRSMPTE